MDIQAISSQSFGICRSACNPMCVSMEAMNGHFARKCATQQTIYVHIHIHDIHESPCSYLQGYIECHNLACEPLTRPKNDNVIVIVIECENTIRPIPRRLLLHRAAKRATEQDNSSTR